MNMVKNLSIRLKLFLSFMIVIFLCMCIFGINVFLNFSRTLQTGSRQNVSQVMSLAQENSLAYMNDVENILFSIQANRTIQEILTSRKDRNVYEEISLLEQELLDEDILRSKISAVHLYAADRPDYPLSYSSTVTGTKMVEQEVWYKKSMELAGRTYWTVMDVPNANGAITASRVLLDTKTHEILGMIRIDVNLSLFTESLYSIHIGETGRLFLVYKNHIVNLWQNNYISSFINNKDFFNVISDETIPDGYIKVDDEKHLVSYRNLKSPDLKVVSAVKYSEINESSRIIANAMVVTAIITIAIAMLLLFILSGRITVPLILLSESMKDFGKTDGTNPDLEEYASNDEIGTLYKTYRAMLSTIDNLISDVNLLYRKQKIFELKALQAQINPHFLYNTLDSINWMAKKAKAKDISKMVTALGSFFRHSLNKGLEYTTIDNELKQIVSYTDIQKIRFDNAFEIYFDVDESLLHYAVIKLSIQPLVENCIVHGFEDIDYTGIIEISCYRETDYIYICVKDNGKGCDTGALNEDINREFNFDEPIEKYGLNNVNQRIRLYFSKDCGLHFETNETGGVTALIKIQIKEL